MSVQRDPMDELRSFADSAARTQKIDPWRYRKLRRFFVRGLLHAFWWEVLLNQPLLRRFRKPWLPRYTRMAERYRDLAIELGGVLIKLGQFMSARVDVLPREITQVLKELQDEVPPAEFDAISWAIEDDLGRPLDAVFESVSTAALGAASLAQVHAARLVGGEPVVVKVLRPGIEVLVETDLAALAFAARWLRLWRPIRRRVNLQRLIREFTKTTRRELDLEIEGRSAERFAENFIADPAVRVPRIYWQQSATRTLTMEDVSFIKAHDHPALTAAGISRSELAAKVYGAYMEQIFHHNFVHADPHPGNIFVHPLAGDEEDGESTPFELVFVDFGMMAEVPDRLREALRDYAIGLATRDPQRIVQAYSAAGVLLPGADLRRLEEIHQDLLDRLWGVRMGQMQEVALSEARYFLREYWDVVAEMPFQMPTDLLFVGRAFGLLSGLATSLDPEFDPWAETVPFAERLARGELGGRIWETVFEQGRVMLRLPAQASRFYRQASRGGLTVEASLSPDARRWLRGLERGVRRLNWWVLGGGLLVSGVLLELQRSEEWWGSALIAASLAAYAWGLIRR